MDDPTAENKQSNTTPPPSYSSLPPVGEQESTELAEEHHDTSQKDDQPAAQSACERWQKHTLPERVMAYFTGVVAVCAALQIWILIGGSGQTDKLIKAANINACSAQKSAKAAQDFALAAQHINQGVADAVGKLNTQASAATDANTLNSESLRARIERRNTALERSVQVGEPIQVIADFENMGHSPAFDVRSNFHVARLNSLPQGPMQITLPKSGDILEPGAPGTKFYMADKEVASDAFLRQLPTRFDDNSARTIFFYGRIEYVTLRKKHHTEFCFSLIRMNWPEAVPTPSVERSYALRQCPKWHSAD